MNRQVLISLISLADELQWQKNFDYIKQNEIKEFALFVTTLSPEKRQEVYNKIELLGDVSVPFVHARQDFTVSEMEYLTKTFGVKYFNLHSPFEFKWEDDFGPVKDKILIENTPGFPLDEEVVAKFGGVCLDLAHLESDRLSVPDNYKQSLYVVKRHPVIANHISGIDVDNPHIYNNVKAHDIHNVTDMKQIKFLEHYSEEFWGEYVTIELTNDIETQLEIKQYIEKILSI